MTDPVPIQIPERYSSPPVDDASLPPPEPREPDHRLLVIQQVYHLRPEALPAGEETRVSRELVSREQPHVRQTRVGEAWTRLDVGWVGSCPEGVGLVWVRNHGTRFQVNPTAEERAEAARKSILVAVEVEPGVVIEFAEVPPGESLAITPRNVSAIRLRCVVGSVAATLSAFPR